MLVQVILHSTGTLVYQHIHVAIVVRLFGMKNEYRSHLTLETLSLAFVVRMGAFFFLITLSHLKKYIIFFVMVTVEANSFKITQGHSIQCLLLHQWEAK